MIQLDNVTKKYIAAKALRQCSITLEPGRMVGVIGENGSGKTTMLKLISGLLHPTKGEVLIEGKYTNRRISEKVAFLTDQDYFYPYFSIRELMSFYQSQFADFNREKAEMIIDFMQLEQNRKVKHLSKGNLARVKFMVTLARRAPYIVLDEPFSGLDPMVRKAIINSMLKFVDLSGQTVIISTHDVNEVEPILDDVVLLKHGKIIAHKAVEQIREEFAMNVVDWMERVDSLEAVSFT